MAKTPAQRRQAARERMANARVGAEEREHKAERIRRLESIDPATLRIELDALFAVLAANGVVTTEALDDAVAVATEQERDRLESMALRVRTPTDQEMGI